MPVLVFVFGAGGSGGPRDGLEGFEVGCEARAVGTEAACSCGRVVAAGTVEHAAEGWEHGFELVSAAGADLEVVDAAVVFRVFEAVPVSVVFYSARAGPLVREDFGEGEYGVHVRSPLHEDRRVGGPHPCRAHVAA